MNLSLSDRKSRVIGRAEGSLFDLEKRVKLPDEGSLFKLST